MKTVKLKIQSFEHRENIGWGLVASGYKTWVEQTTDFMHNTSFFICFEVKDEEIKEAQDETK